MSLAGGPELRKFVAPELVLGARSPVLAGRCARNLGARKALVATDPGVVQTGWVGRVIDSLKAGSVPYDPIGRVVGPAMDSLNQETRKNVLLQRMSGLRSDAGINIALGGSVSRARISTSLPSTHSTIHA
ncbi:MAG: hypothetical protein P8076_11325 [Gammaproteobacteria bacterium]